MPWLQVHIDAARDKAELISDALSAAGALSVTLTDAQDQPILEPGLGETPLWNATIVVGLFEPDVDPDDLHKKLVTHVGPDAIHSWQAEELADQLWERAWMDQFKPMRFGQRLWICPSHLEPPDPTAVNLRLDPGLAFGTGTHSTTALCLEWLDGASVEGKTVIDYGCGSGVLAIAALLLGAKQAICVDIDPQALTATLDNAERNGVADKIKTYLPGAMPSGNADLVLANILAGPLVELAPTLSQLVKPGGDLVLSGLLAEQGEEVAAAYADLFVIKPFTQREEWIRLDGQRRRV